MERLEIVHTLRTVADVIEDAMRVGVPEPQTVSVTWHSRPTLIMGTFPDVEEWALYLEVEATRRTSDSRRIEHIDAEADLADPYGIGVLVTSNHPAPRVSFDEVPSS